MKVLYYGRSYASTVLKNTNAVKLSATIRRPKIKCCGHLFFLHGLLGNRYNLSQLQQDMFITSYFVSHLLDMRNHGDSDHCPTMSYKEMANDIIRYADENIINNYILCGHSMGGKIATAVASLVPERVDSLIIMDAPPTDVRNTDYFKNVTKPALEKMYKLAKFDKGESYEDAVARFHETFKGTEKNFAVLLERNLLNVEGKPQWKCNMDSIVEYADSLFSYVDLGCYLGFNNVLVLEGEKSVIYGPEVYRKTFPQIALDNIIKVANAGHWIHADNLKDTRKYIRDYLELIIDQYH